MGSRRPDLAAEVAEELRFHIEGRARELMAQGWPEDAARREALRMFGDLARIDAECRQLSEQRLKRQRRGVLMSNLWQDLRFGLRSLRRSPGFAVVAVLTLALGIGATTAIFTVLDTVVLRPLPLEEPDRLVVVWERNDGQGIERERPSAPNYHDWREGTRRFEGLAAWTEESLTLSGGAQPDVLSAVSATSNFFDVLRARPLLGRTFAAEEGVGEGSRVAVLSYGAWQRVFGGDAAVIGRTIVLDQAPFEVIGVMPAAFRVPRTDTDLWVPSGFPSQQFGRQSRYLQVVGRLAPGASQEQASADLNAIAERLETLYPESNHGWRVTLVEARDQVVGEAGLILLVIFAAVGFVLVLACVNVANLVLGRSIARDTEMALRGALGAGRGRLRAQLVTENLLLGGLGGALGVLLAYAALRMFLNLEPEAVPRVEEIAVDARVLVFALLASVGTGLLFGLVPGVRAAENTEGLLRAGRQAGTRRTERIRRVLIVAEVALSVVLLIGAGLAVRSLLKLRAVDPGFATANVLAARVNLDQPRYPTSDSRRSYFDELLERLRVVPGITAAGVTSTLPLTHGIDFDLPYRAEGHPDLPEGQLEQADYRVISPGYLEAMGIPLLRGRAFTPQDRLGSRRVIILNERFAETLWPGENPIGKTVRIYYAQTHDWEVVGVIGDTRHRGLSTPPAGQMYVPLAQADVAFGFMTVVMRKAPGAPSVERSIREVAASFDPNEPLYSFVTIEGLLEEATARERLAATVFGLFALLAIALSAAGIYGVISYQVARRTREIGVRMALGAARSRVLAGVVAETAGLTALGIGIGLAIAASAARVATGWIYGISATDPATLTGVSALLLAVAILAALVPALRASSIHPVEALRQE